MTVRIRMIILTLILLIPCNAYTLHKNPWSSEQYSGENLIIKLVTIDPGDEIYTWWGHTAIIVEDKNARISRFYNYGLFSFVQENFYLNFAMGRLYFQVGAFNTKRELSIYRRMNRGIRIQVLDLSPARKLEMARFLDENVLPQNREYLYHHYNDNCATRVRDLIDRIVDGRLFEAAQNPGRMTLRRHTRRFTHHNAFIDWLLTFLMGNSIDKPISEWDEMFLPSELEKNVRKINIPDGQGGLKPLVSEEILFYNSTGCRTIPEKAPPHWPFGLIIGISIGCIALILNYWMQKGKALGRVIFGLYNGMIGLLFGIPGLILFFLSLFTDHTVTYTNENLFFANPVALAAIPLGIRAALGRKRSQKWLALTWLILFSAGLLSLILKLFPGFNQQNWITISVMLPGLSILAFAWMYKFPNCHPGAAGHRLHLP